MTTPNDGGHTPGPWLVDVDWPCGVMALDGEYVARTNEDFRSSAECWANARLIASAPDLLEALEGALRLLEYPLDEDDRDRPELNTIHAAIAKARGEKP